VSLFDWLRRGRRGADPDPLSGGKGGWQVRVEGPEVVAEDGRGGSRRAVLIAARSVRVVPLTGGDHHASGRGWQVTLSRPEGDVLLGGALPDWQSARDLAQQVCERTQLPLDQLTQRLFSRVGSATRL
jgi:hypothetical protein